MITVVYAHESSPVCARLFDCHLHRELAHDRPPSAVSIDDCSNDALLANTRASSRAHVAVLHVEAILFEPQHTMGFMACEVGRD